MIVGIAGTNVVRLAPSLICEESHLDQIVEILSRIIPEFLEEAGELT
jgi:4-aminobutyrate aminotransferase-like enzyme